MSNKTMKKNKGDIYALALPENKGYIYVYYIAGNSSTGDMMSVFDYSTKEFETDMEKILSQPSLYKQNPFIGHIDVTEGNYVKVGNVKPDYNKYINKPIYTRGSIQCGSIWDKYRPFSENNLDGQWKEMEKDLKNGIQYFCDDWRFEEYKITTLRGKLELKAHWISIGKLNKSQHNVFLYNIIPSYKDYIQKYLTGYDRNSILYSLYL